MEIKQPVRPTLLWDGDCAFCAHWIRRWEKLVGDAVDCRAYQEALDEFPQVVEAECQKAVQLVLKDGRVLSAAPLADMQTDSLPNMKDRPPFGAAPRPPIVLSPRIARGFPGFKQKPPVGQKKN
jgi:hypothetical protein